MKKFLVIIAALGLTGCATAPPPQIITKTETTVIMPDRSMFNCPNVRRFPDPKTLTDLQVAHLLVELHTNNTVCQKNINGIYDFLDKAKRTTEGESASKK